MTSTSEPWFTEESLNWLRSQEINIDAAGWNFVSSTPLSVARFYGCATVNGKRYTYMPASDELVRDDLVKPLKKFRRAKKVAEPEQASFPLGGEHGPIVEDGDGTVRVTIPNHQAND